MSVVATNAYSTATGNGATTSFPYTFAARNGADVAVYVNGALQVGGFTVTPNVGFNGGTVLFTTPPANLAAIIMQLAPSLQQSTKFVNAGAYNPESVDGANDQAAIRDIYLKGLLDRAALVPLGESMGPLPAAASRIGKFFGFDAGGNPTALSGTGNDTALRTDLAASAGSALAGFLQSGTGAVARTVQAKLRDIVGSADYSSTANALTASNNLLPIVDTSAGSVGYQDTAFSITKAQASSKFKAFQTVANGVGFNAFQSITLNGTVVAGTNANFLATAISDNVNFSGWGLRGGAGSNPLVVSNFGCWIENNLAIAWSQEVDVNNEGATQAEGSDSGGVGIAINTGSTYSPDTAVWVRRQTGAGSGPGFLRGINIEGARVVGFRAIAMDTTTYPSLTPAAPGTLTAFATAKSSDSQYRFTISESGVLSWGAGGASVADVTLSRSGVGALSCSGSFAIGGGTAITKVVAYAPSITPASVAAATVAEQTFTVAGLTTADKVIVNPPAIANATGIAGARVSAADTLAIRFVNPTAGALTPSSGTYTVMAFRS